MVAGQVAVDHRVLCQPLQPPAVSGLRHPNSPCPAGKPLLNRHAGRENVPMARFCEESVNTLVYPGCSEEIKETDPWICFLCVPWDVYGLLKRRTTWRAELKCFYDQDITKFKGLLILHTCFLWDVFHRHSAQIYPLLPPWQRKSIHVLSLFDDITQELKSFGFLGKSMGNGRWKFLDDVTNVTRTDIEEWEPYDFIFGSTPPVAKSYKHPSVWETCRKMQQAIFWMFLDNIVLDKEARDTASRFFQVEAVLRYKQHNNNIQNAVHIWSNIPSVNSKYSASSLCMGLSLLAKHIQRTRIFSQRPATLIREFFVPLKDYFRAFP
ncbi:DNA (cytosine-5)-methyltransferase 3-like [Varanus komodoensis]|nr:DNA (cytosine-5)-methyltransferase 3-like [Varanus komodoensis]